MASQTWSPLHPSPGFLLKCGKENEKLKVKIRGQLQSHMLNLFENGLFSDVTIESQHPEQQTGLVVKAHRAVLLVRVPAFWKELLTTCTVGGKDPNAFSISVEHRYLRDFIRSVYSDDDIRRQEYDIVRLLRSRNTPSSGDEDNDDHDMTLEPKEDGPAETSPRETMDSGAFSTSLQQHGAEDSLENFRSCFADSGGKEDVGPPDDPGPECNGDEPLDSLRDEDCELRGNDSSCENQNELSASMSSSMVRSGTFDLQSQMPLEVAIEKWSAEEQNQMVGASEPGSVEDTMGSTTELGLPDGNNSRLLNAAHSPQNREKKSVAAMPAFFLHEKSVAAPMPVSYQCTPTRMPERGDRPRDREALFGMVDSGFLSQNTSVNEGIAYDSLNDPGNEEELTKVKDLSENDNEQPASGALFPFYIDINKARAEEKQPEPPQSTSSSSSVYMYIDAKGSEKASGDAVPLSSSEGHRREDSSSRRPQSCYMYVDFNSVHREQPASEDTAGSSRVPRTLSLSMFIDINDEQNESVASAQEAYRNHRAEPSGRVREDVVGCRRKWEHFEREEILVVSEEFPVVHRPSEPSQDISHASAELPMGASPRRMPQAPEVCLLPMSPILRRKDKPEPPRVVAKAASVKSSTRPQDVDAMTFRRSEPSGHDSDSLEHDSDKEEEKPQEVKPQAEGVTSGVPLGVSRQDEPGSPVTAATATDSVPEVAEHTFQPPVSPVYGEEEDSETVYSEVSEGSCLSSVDRRTQDPGSSPERLGSCSKLGDDLLRMFVGQVEADVKIRVEGKDIDAHRFILASRSEYFASLLGEDHSDTDEDCISMDGFTHGAVLFALQHVYGGVVSLPKDVHISELALLADMLGLDSLRRVVLSHIRTYYCHFFHKPCSQCIAGMSECLQMPPSCGLRELQSRVVQWVGRHYVRVWPHRAFASVPEPQQQLCYTATLQALTAESAIEMALNCERLSVTLPRVRWAESALCLVNRLIQDCVAVMAREFNLVLQSKSFLDLGKGQSWNITALEETILTAVETLSPDVACLSCIQLAQLLPEDDTQLDACEWTQNFTGLLRKIQRQCERFLIHNANRVVHCKSWAALSPQLQKKIRDAAVIVFEFEKPTAPPPRLSGLRRKPRRKSTGTSQTSEPRGSASPTPVRKPRSSTISSSPKTSGSDSSEFPGIERGRRPNPVPRPSLSSEADHGREEPGKPPLSPQEHKSVLSGIMSESLESYRESSSDSGKEQSVPVRTEKKLAVGARNARARTSRVTRSSSNVPGELGARPKSGATWAAPLPPGPPKPMTGWASPQSRPPTQYFQSLRHVQSKVDTGRTIGGSQQRCGGQVVRVPPFTIKSDASPREERAPHNLGLHPVNNLVAQNSPEERNNNDENNAYDDSSAATEDPSPEDTAEGTSPDFVAEIDAESNLVSHCLHEAELLERELSRKLRKQKRDAEPLYTRPPGLRGGPASDYRRRVAPVSSSSPSEARGKPGGVGGRSPSTRSDLASASPTSTRPSGRPLSRVSGRVSGGPGLSHVRPLSESRTHRVSGIAVATQAKGVPASHR